ncbi:hypothetical protein DRO24_00845 [Candidatus Bathyarchaeota archaeon]|nr:MAG: hypothetical protein DRO24_00845 [Candidatus Bathyarchaeota archaeon]
MKGIYRFLWNRWYINPLYYAIFVDGLLALKDAIFKFFESAVVDRGLNEGVPAVFTGLYHRVKRLQTGVLSYNMLYIALAYIALLLTLLYLMGGV